MHQAISFFDIFKIGIGPSSSHTLGPWRAANLFCNYIKNQNSLDQLAGVRVLLYGSLAKTGKGHGTDIAMLLGLSGEDPVTFAVDQVSSSIETIQRNNCILFAGEKQIQFNPALDIEFLFSETLAHHPNGMTFLASLENGEHLAKTYYSIGGGFVEEEGVSADQKNIVVLPFPVDTANDLLHWCMKTGLAISEIVLENENAWRAENLTREGVLNIWSVMSACIYKGCHTTGMLPGGLQVKRRASDLNKIGRAHV
jgi:L-serine dehydratase